MMLAGMSQGKKTKIARNMIVVDKYVRLAARLLLVSEMIKGLVGTAFCLT